MSESLSFTPTTTAESPTWATYILTPRMTMTLAVVPDVLGRPVMVLGHSAVGEEDTQDFSQMLVVVHRSGGLVLW